MWRWPLPYSRVVCWLRSAFHYLWSLAVFQGGRSWPIKLCYFWMDSSRVGVRESCVIQLVRRRRSWNSTGSVGRRKTGDEKRESEQRWEKAVHLLRALAVLHALVSSRLSTRRSQPISHGNQWRRVLLPGWWEHRESTELFSNPRGETWETGIFERAEAVRRATDSRTPGQTGRRELSPLQPAS